MNLQKAEPSSPPHQSREEVRASRKKKKEERESKKKTTGTRKTKFSLEDPDDEAVDWPPALVNGVFPSAISFDNCDTQEDKVKVLLDQFTIKAGEQTAKMTQTMQALRTRHTENKDELQKQELMKLFTEVVWTFGCVSYKMYSVTEKLVTGNASLESKLRQVSETNHKPESAECPDADDTADDKLAHIELLWPSAFNCLSKVDRLSLVLGQQAANLRKMSDPKSGQGPMHHVLKQLDGPDSDHTDDLLMLDKALHYASSRAQMLQNRLGKKMSIKTASTTLLAAVRWRRKGKAGGKKGFGGMLGGAKGAAPKPKVVEKATFSMVIRKATNLRDTDFFGTSDPFVKVTIKTEKAGTITYKTNVVDNNLNPEFSALFDEDGNQVFDGDDDHKDAAAFKWVWELAVHGKVEDFRLEVWDEDSWTANDSLGYCKVDFPTRSVATSPPEHFKDGVALENKFKGEPSRLYYNWSWEVDASFWK